MRAALVTESLFYIGAPIDQRPQQTASQTEAETTTPVLPPALFASFTTSPQQSVTRAESAFETPFIVPTVVVSLIGNKAQTPSLAESFFAPPRFAPQPFAAVSDRAAVLPSRVDEPASIIFTPPLAFAVFDVRQPPSPTRADQPTSVALSLPVVFAGDSILPRAAPRQDFVVNVLLPELPPEEFEFWQPTFPDRAALVKQQDTQTSTPFFSPPVFSTFVDSPKLTRPQDFWTDFDVVEEKIVPLLVSAVFVDFVTQPISRAENFNAPFVPAPIPPPPPPLPPPAPLVTIGGAGAGSGLIAPLSPGQIFVPETSYALFAFSKQAIVRALDDGQFEIVGAFVVLTADNGTRYVYAHVTATRRAGRIKRGEIIGTAQSPSARTPRIQQSNTHALPLGGDPAPSADLAAPTAPTEAPTIGVLPMPPPAPELWINEGPLQPTFLAPVPPPPEPTALATPPIAVSPVVKKIVVGIGVAAILWGIYTWLASARKSAALRKAPRNQKRRRRSRRR